MSQCTAVYNHFVNGYVFHRQQQQQQMSFSVSREMSFWVSARTHFTHAMWLLFVVYRCYIFEAVYWTGLQFHCCASSRWRGLIKLCIPSCMIIPKHTPPPPPPSSQLRSGVPRTQKLKSRLSTDKGVNQCSKDVTQTQQQRPESPTVTLTWHASKCKVHKLHQ